MTDNTLSIPNGDSVQECRKPTALEFLLLWIKNLSYMEDDKQELVENVKAMTKTEQRDLANDLLAQIKAARQSELKQQQQSEVSSTAEVIQLPPSAEFDREWVRRIEEEEAAYEDNNEYTIVENWLLEHPDPRIKGKEIAIYTLLDLHCHMPKKTCWVSISSLAERTGWQRETVREALKNLIAVGAIEREEVGSRYKWTIVHRHRTKSKKGQQRKRAGNGW